VIVSSGRGVHEALAAVEILARKGIKTGVLDMPSVDEEMMLEIATSGKLLVFAEQNNGYLSRNFLNSLYRRRATVAADILKRVLSISTLNAHGMPQFIHSGTYGELTAAFGLTPEAIANSVAEELARLQK
jgi:transketolase C-terminal domain/subunit